MAEIVDFLRHSRIFFGNIPAFFVDGEKKSVGDIEI